MEASDSISRTADWKFSLAWIHANRARVTSRAYSSFIATHVGWQAAAQRSWSDFVPLLWDAFRHGSLRAVDLVRYFGFWFVPATYRDEIKRWWRPRSQRENPSATDFFVSPQTK